MPHRCLLWFAFLFFPGLPGIALSQDADPAPAAEEEKDWLEYYYEHPTPDRFVAQMKDLAAEGVLDNDHAKPAIIAFVSQLIRQNHDRLKEWHDGLAGLEPAHMQVIYTAMLFSRTEEADAMMRELYGKEYDEQKLETQKILEMPLDKQSTLDMLWGFYYATGSEEAVRRIVTIFQFLEAPEKPPGVAVPEGYVPVYKILPELARGSLVSNGKRHPKLVEILAKLLKEDADLEPVEKQGIYDVLSELDPKAYPPKA